MKIKYFAAVQGFRDWLAEHYADQTELWVGYYKKETGRWFGTDLRVRGSVPPCCKSIDDRRH